LAEIVDLGSFSRAALVLHVTQPTLSRTIKQLEDRVGAPVLKRARYGVTPTSIGQVLAQQGRAIRASVGAAQTGVREWKAGLDLELRVGVGPMIALALLPRFLEVAFRSAGQPRMRFRTEPPTKLIESVQAGEIDLALAPAELYFSDDALAQKRAFADTVGVYAGRGHPLARIRKAKVSELGDYDWIGIGSLSRFRGTTGEILETIGAGNIRTKMEFSGDVATPIELLRSGKWLGLVPDFLRSFLPGADDLIRISLPKALPKRDIAFWFRRDLADHPQLARFFSIFATFLGFAPHATSTTRFRLP
jgi:DNA-binding transcriptional LysR family regulator